ncbi:hypothetical protein BKA80DRAFT_33243 [Phyllosticta citrichinensis]
MLPPSQPCHLPILAMSAPSSSKITTSTFGKIANKTSLALLPTASRISPPTSLHAPSRPRPLIGLRWRHSSPSFSSSCPAQLSFSRAAQPTFLTPHALKSRGTQPNPFSLLPPSLTMPNLPLPVSSPSPSSPRRHSFSARTPSLSTHAVIRPSRQSRAVRRLPRGHRPCP